MGLRAAGSFVARDRRQTTQGTRAVRINYRAAMKCCYHPDYQAGLTSDHPFPISKYPLLRDLLLGEGIISHGDLLEPEPIPMAAVARVHTADYLAKLTNGSLSAAEIRRLGLPWSQALWRRSLLASGGTLLAARHALTEGLAGNLAGGTHHAFADHGEGFCVINDVAIAIRQLQAENMIGRAAVIDLDVHQGNGTASIFANDEAVFTFSMHGDSNYPLRKLRSSLDIGFAANAGDAEYLAALAQYLPAVLHKARADIALYIAGVDVAAGDLYGKLNLTDAGIRAREQRVISAVRGAGVPLVIVLAGGYAATRARTAQLHAHVFREAAAYESAAQMTVMAPP
ncbi:MAG: histone deacetylase [Steroidobacterales bacterium]